MKAKILCLPGDGVGSEIMDQTMAVLTSIACAFSHQFTFITGKAGGSAIETDKVPISQKTLDLAKTSDAILLGPIGGAKWDMLLGGMRPECTYAHLVNALNLTSAFVSCNISSSLYGVSPLRYNFGHTPIEFSLFYPIDHSLPIHSPFDDSDSIQITVSQNRKDIRKIAHTAFSYAQDNGKVLHNVDQSNLFVTSRLWREVVIEVSHNYPDVALHHLLPEECVSHITANPTLFKTILSEGLWGNILAHQMGAISGSTSLIPSMWFNNQSTFPRLYHPIHGAYLDVAQKDVANPLAMIKAASLMLRHSLKLQQEADCIDMAIENVLLAGWRTIDISSDEQNITTTSHIGQLICEQIDIVGNILSETYPFS